MIRYIFLTYILIQALPFRAFAAEPYKPQMSDPMLESWRWQSFPQLKGPGFRTVVEDTKNHLWFGTDSGVKHYDGITWTDYTTADGLHGAPINVLCAAKDSSVYAGSRKGISQFKNGSWHRVFPLDPKVDWTIWSIREAADGTIWSGTARGALSISPNGDLRYYTTNDCADGLKIIAPWMTYVIVPDKFVTPKGWSNNIGIKVALGLPPDGGPITGAVIRAVAPNGPAGRAGVRVGDRILSRQGKDSPPDLKYNGPPGTTAKMKLRYLNDTHIRDVEIPRESVSGQFRDFWIFDAYPDSKGTIWFAVRTGELIRYNGSSENPLFERFDAKDGIEITDVRPGTKLIESPDGFLWAVTIESGGLNKFDGTSWSSSKLADLGGSDQNASVSLSPDGTMWIGGESTLHAYRQGQWTVYQAPKALIPNGRIIVQADKSNRLWVGGIGHGISNVDLGQNHFETYQNLSFQFETNNGTQWFLTSEGSPVSFFQKWSQHPITDQNPDISIIALVPAIDNEIWAVGNQQNTVEIYRYNNTRWQKSISAKISSKINPTSISTLNDGAVWFGSDDAAYQYTGQKLNTYRTNHLVHAIGQTTEGTVWISSRTNLYRLENQTIQQITQPEALNRTITKAILGSKNGDLWIGTEFFGLFQFDGTFWKRHDIQDGLPDNNITDIIDLPDGHIIASTVEGMSRFDGQAWVNYLTDIPNAAPNGLRVGPQNQHWINTKNQHTIHHTPRTQAPQTTITVNLTKVSQPGNTILSWQGADPWRASTQHLMFSHRLDNEDWSPYTPSTNRVLLSQPSGQHTFQVRARNTDFIVDPSPSQLTFQVAPPLWREPWLVITVFCLIFAGVTQTVRIVQRDRQLQKTNKDLQVAQADLERRVALRTKELKETNEQLIFEAAERQKTERELIHLERLRALGEMSAGISHNLNNMLTGILGPAQMVKDLMTNPSGQFYADTILKSAARARDLVERLHQAVRGQKKNIQGPVQVNQVVLDAIQTTRPRWKDEMESRGIVIEMLTQLETVPEIKANQTGLHDVLVNLIFNALDAMPDGGSITLATDVQDGHVMIRIRDTGEGMNEETQARVFEPFFTTKMNIGTGLGLFTVHGEIESWNGDIDVKSTIGKGTTFTIQLPALLALTIEPEPIQNKASHVQKRSILIVDDEEVVRDIVVHELSKHHHVISDINGIDARETIAKQNFEIAFIDLGMPGMPGDTLAQQIKETNPTIATILMTGWILDEDDPRLEPFDFNIQKPIETHDLHRIIALAAQLHETREQALET
ncbi:MAG: response regulator [Candidatus Latescibacteria bacterium]|nr:response regulator [Candidatus Latescibacterota bacterium]